MSKSNFEKLAKAPMFARPPRAEEVAGPGYGAARAIDGPFRQALYMPAQLVERI